MKQKYGTKQQQYAGQTTHGLTNIPPYKTWSAMKNRCLNPNAPDYKYYGGKGVTIYEEWLDFKNFYNWSMANGFRKGLTIDRIDVNGNYEPNNCRWVDMKVQSNNKTNNHTLTYNGETHTINEWADITGLSRILIRDRVNRLHWSVDKALTTPPRKCNRNT